MPGGAATAVQLGAGLLIVIATTLPLGSSEATFGCILCGQRAVADALVNIALFVPLGIGFGLAGRRFRTALLLSALLSSLVELVQLALPQRDPSLGDVLSNAVGGSLGFLVVASSGWWLGPPPGRASGLSVFAALMACAVVALTGVLLQPSFPNTIYYGHWTPNLMHLERYRGRVLEARVGSIPVLPERLTDSDTVRRLLRAGAPLQVSAVAGPPTSRLGPLFTISDDRQRGVLLIGPRRDDLVLRYRTRSTTLRLDRPDLRLSGALGRISPGDTLHIQAQLSPPRYCLSVNGSASCALGHTIGSGWTLLFYADGFPDWLIRLLSLGWAVLLGLPVGFWTRRPTGGILAGALLATAVLLLPRGVGLLPTPPAELFCVAAGFMVGLAGAPRHRTAARRPP